MKKLIAVLLALVLMLSFAACAKTEQKPANNQDNTTKTTFTVGFDQEFPPYGFVDDNGEFTGFDLELAAECAKRMGMEVKYQPIDWDAKDLELESGKIDCIWNGFTINGREDGYTWTAPYVNNSQVFVVRTDSNIKAFEDLSGKIVTAQADSSALNALNNDYPELVATFSQFLTCADYNSAFMELEQGTVDAIAMDVGVAKYMITKSGENFTVLDKDISAEQYAVGFKKGNTELADKVQATLEDMVKDGKFAEISTKWFGEDVGIIGK